MKNRALPLLLLVVATTVAGCSRVIVLRDPITGHTFQCKQSRSDVMAGIGLAQGAEDCAQFHEKLGYRRVR